MLRDTPPLFQSSEDYFFHPLLFLFSPSFFLEVTLIYVHVFKPSLNLPVARVIKHPLPERKPKPVHDTEKQKNSSCKTCNTPAPIAPRKRENPLNSQYSKPTLKTETRKKIETRAEIKEELETRRQQMKYYFCAVIGVLSLLRKFTPR